VQTTLSRKTFLQKMAAGISLAGLSGLFFGSRAEASARGPKATAPAVQRESRSVARSTRSR
jgi:hypothetical protein